MQKKVLSNKFVILGRRTYVGPIVFAKIKSAVAIKKIGLVIGVPKVCGSAVKRNRFRRMVRARCLSAGLREGIWIRLQRDYKLEAKMTYKEWEPLFGKGLSGLL